MLCVLMALPAGRAASHPMGPNSFNHYAAITVHHDAVRIHYILDIAEFPTYTIIKTRISPRGAKTWADADLARYQRAACPQLARGLSLYIDNKKQNLKSRDCRVQVRASKFAPIKPEQKFDLRAQQRRKIPWYTLWIEMELEARVQAAAGTRREAEYEDANFADEPAGWKEIELLGSNTARIVKTHTRLSSLHSARLNGNTLSELAKTVDPSRMPRDAAAAWTYERGAGAASEHAAASRVRAGWLARAKARLPELPDLLEASYFLPLALGLAFALGCLHALSPGHGKTLVAAYLIGSRGRVSDAVFLGLVVTVSHVLSVVVLGVVLMAATAGISSARITVLLEGASGLLIVLIGLWMFARNAAGRGPAHVHDEFGRHVDHSHHYGDGHAHTHHGQDHAHHHAHGHNHAPEPPVRAGWWDITVLGVTGGIVPCPTALIVLFSAVALHRIVLGLALIVAFSVGLACVLIAIGILMVKAKGLMHKSLRQSGLIRFLPYVSATIITLIGAAFLLRALIALGWL